MPYRRTDGRTWLQQERCGFLDTLKAAGFLGTEITGAAIDLGASVLRRAAKRDLAEPSVVEALEAAGYMVWRELPCDLLVFRAGRFYCLEVKTATKSGKTPIRKDRAKQNSFCELTGTPRVTSAEMALRALGE